MIHDEGPTEEGVGSVFVPAYILLAALLIWSLGCQPAEALEGCVDYSTICVPGYLVRWLPPEPTTNSVPITHELVGQDLVRAIAAYYWPAWAVERMVRIAECETVPDWDPRSLNPSSGAAGIWQIMPGWQRTWPGNYFDPWTNGAVAYQIWLVQGFAAWVCTGHL